MKKLKVLIVAPYLASDKGGNPLAVFRWVQMIKDKVEVWLYSTEQKKASEIVDRFFYQEAPDTLSSKIRKIWTYYKTDFPKPNFLDKPDLIQIHNPHFWALGKYFPNTPKILFEHDVNWNLLKYALVHGPGLKKLPFKKWWRPWFLWRASQFEKKALLEADHVFVYSEVDKKEILKKIPKIENKITIIPNFLDVSLYPRSNELGNTILFMGPLDYIANLDAVDILCQELAPRLPQYPFKIVGKGSYPKRYPQNVQFLGFVPDLLPYLEQARVFIAPLRYGSGTRFKIVEALAMQRPVVSTPKGAEGLEVVHGVHIWLEQDWDRFAEAIDHLWRHPEAGKKLGQAGRKLIEEKHDYKKNSSLVLEVYEKVLRNK